MPALWSEQLRSPHRCVRQPVCAQRPCHSRWRIEPKVSETETASVRSSDAQRTVAPLRPADDAVRIDTTGLAIETVVEQVLALLPSR